MEIRAGDGYVLLKEIEKESKELTLVNSSVEMFAIYDCGSIFEEKDYCFCDRKDLRELIVGDKKYFIVKEENVLAYGEELEEESD